MEAHILTTEGLTFSTTFKTREDKMHIKKITGTIKGGVDADLTEKTLIVGGNGAGKSAIVNAVELALVGGASDIEGRAWVQDVKRLKRLGDSVHVEATLDDDTTCSYRVVRSKANHQNGVGGSLPYREVRDALTGSPAKAYKFLLGHCAKNLTFNDIVSNLPPDLHELYRSIAVGETNVLGLLEAQDRSAKKARDAAKEAKGAKEASHLAGQGLGPLPLESDIAAAQKAVEHFSEAQLRETLTQQIRRLTESIQNKPQGPTVDQHAKVKRYLLILGEHLSMNHQVCSVCAHPFDRVKGQQTYDQLAAWLQANPEDWDPNEHQNLVNERTRLEERLNALSAVDVPPDAPARLHALLTAKAGHDQYERLRETVRDMEKRAEHWKDLSGRLDELVKKFVDQGMLEWSIRVQSYLPEDDIFGFNITKSDCQVGFIRDGWFVTALSGAEWAKLLTAIACACAEDGVPVVIPEERMWDRETLAKTMRALKDAPCQIILTSTEKPKGKLPAGWSLVEVA